MPVDVNQPRSVVITKSVSSYYVLDDWQNQNNLATFELDVTIPLFVNQSQHLLWLNYTRIPYFVLDDWHVPPVLQGLIQVNPVGQHTLYEGTILSRAYDWLVTQYSMLTPVTPVNPVFTTQGPLIPNYAFNPPSTYTLVRSF